jgi:hypothetical protein
MPYTIGGIVSEAFTFNDSIFTYAISGSPTIADVGKAVTIDTAGPSTMKLTGDNDQVLGRLETFEDRAVLGLKVGAVARRFKCKFPAAVGHSIVVGSCVSGSAVAGEVKLSTTQTEPKPNRCIEVGTDYVVVERI